MLPKILTRSILTILATSFCIADVIKLQIYDMHCPPCSCAVQKSISRLQGVSSVNIDPKLQQANVDFDPQIITIEDILKATEDIGYRSKVITN